MVGNFGSSIIGHTNKPLKSPFKCDFKGAKAIVANYLSSYSCNGEMQGAKATVDNFVSIKW